jgi:hypothetical protein
MDGENGGEATLPLILSVSPSVAPAEDESNHERPIMLTLRQYFDIAQHRSQGERI